MGREGDAGRRGEEQTVLLEGRAHASTCGESRRCTHTAQQFSILISSIKETWLALLGAAPLFFCCLRPLVTHIAHFLLLRPCPLPSPHAPRHGNRSARTSWSIDASAGCKTEGVSPWLQHTCRVSSGWEGEDADASSPFHHASCGKGPRPRVSCGRRLQGLGRTHVLSVASREGFFDTPCWTDCETEEYSVFSGADRVLGVGRGLRETGWSLCASLSHQGVLAVYSYGGRCIIPPTSPRDREQVEVEVEDYPYTAFMT